jgi:hypothetical protein
MKLERCLTSVFFMALLMPSVTFAQTAPPQPSMVAPPAAGAAGAPVVPGPQQQPPPYRPATASPAPGYRPAVPPPPGASQAQFGQPYPVYDPNSGQIVLVSPLVQAQRLPPRELPYSENRPVPAGYALDEYHLRGLIIGGAVTLGTLWAISFSVASSNNFAAANGWLAVPVIGPFGWLATRKAPQCNNSDYYSSCSDESGNRTMVAFDGIGQIAGAGMLIAGLAVTRKRLLLIDPQAAIAVAPYATSRGSGLQIIGQF